MEIEKEKIIRKEKGKYYFIDIDGNLCSKQVPKNVGRPKKIKLEVVDIKEEIK
jgi:hypothetical protein